MDSKVKILHEEMNKYALENETFDSTQFDRVQVLTVVFRAMESYKHYKDGN